MDMVIFRTIFFELFSFLHVHSPYRPFRLLTNLGKHRKTRQRHWLSGPLYPRRSQWAEDSQAFLARLVPRFPEPIASGRLSESTKDEAKSTEGNLTNKGLSLNKEMPASTRCWTRRFKGILTEGNASTVIESLSSFRVRGDRMRGLRFPSVIFDLT